MEIPKTEIKTKTPVSKMQEYEVKMGFRNVTDMDQAREILRCVVSKLPNDYYIIIL